MMRSTTRSATTTRVLLAVVAAVVLSSTVAGGSAGAAWRPVECRVAGSRVSGEVDIDVVQVPQNAVERGTVEITVDAGFRSPGGRIQEAVVELLIPPGVVVTNPRAIGGPFPVTRVDVVGQTLVLTVEEGTGRVDTQPFERVQLPTVTFDALLPEVRADTPLEWDHVDTRVRARGILVVDCVLDDVIHTSTVLNNTRPVAEPQLVATAVGEPVDITLAGSDEDRPAQTLSFAIPNPPRHGTLTGTPPSVTYTPDSGYEGMDSFEFNVHDGLGYRRAEVDLNVTDDDLRPPTVVLDGMVAPPPLGQPAPARLSHQASYAIGQPVQAVYACRDSGTNRDPRLLEWAAECTGDLPSGSMIDTSVAGPRTFTIQGRDAAGNPALRRISYTVMDRAPTPQFDEVLGICPSPLDGIRISVDAPRHSPLEASIPGNDTVVEVRLGNLNLFSTSPDVADPEWTVRPPDHTRFADPVLLDDAGPGGPVGTVSLDPDGRLRISRPGTFNAPGAMYGLRYPMPAVRVTLVPLEGQVRDGDQQAMILDRVAARTRGAAGTWATTECLRPAALSVTTWEDTVGPQVVVTSPTHGRLVWVGDPLEYSFDLETWLSDPEGFLAQPLTPTFFFPGDLLPTNQVGPTVLEVGVVDPHGNETWNTPTYRVEALQLGIHTP